MIVLLIYSDHAMLKPLIEIFYLSYEEAETLLPILHSKKGIVYMLSKSLLSSFYAWL